MARGKHAASSAIRRAEAAHEHIDRLTDQLVEAKAKAKRYESDALALPAVQAEVAKLRRQVEEQTSEKLEREREKYRQKRAAAEERLDVLIRIIRRVSDDHDSILTPSEMLELDKATKGEWTVDSSMSRGDRRACYERPGQLHDSISKIPTHELRSMGLRRVGERYQVIEATSPDSLETLPEVTAK